MKQEKMKYRVICFVLLTGAIAFGLWYVIMFNNRRDISKDSTLVKEGHHIICCLSDAGKTIAGCLHKGVKSL